MSDEVKACPFCGAEARRESTGYAVVHKFNCHFSWNESPVTRFHESKAPMWNHRTTEDQLRAQLAEQTKLRYDALKETGTVRGHLALALEEGDALRAQLAAVTRERDQLKAWKESQMSIEASWDEQEVGKLLELRLGEAIRPAIAPAIQKLKARLEEAYGALRNALVPLAVFKLTDDRQPYVELSSAFRSDLHEAHDVVLRVLERAAIDPPRK